MHWRSPSRPRCSSVVLVATAELDGRRPASCGRLASLPRMPGSGHPDAAAVRTKTGRAQTLFHHPERTRGPVPLSSRARIANRKPFALMYDIWQPDAMRSFHTHRRSAFHQEVIRRAKSRQLLFLAV
jgi:hypothetical protein